MSQNSLYNFDGGPASSLLNSESFNQFWNGLEDAPIFALESPKLTLQPETQAQSSETSQSDKGTFEISSAMIIRGHNNATLGRESTIKLNQPLPASYEELVKPTIPGQMPVFQSFAGDHDFTISFAPSPRETRSTLWSYSSVLQKLFVKIDTLCPFHISLDATGASNLPENCVIRVTPVYREPDNIKIPVVRCPNHISAGSVGFSPANKQHFLQSDHPQVRYEVDGNGYRPVIVPYEVPATGGTYTVYLFKFLCFSSCVGSINRRIVDLIFTLEGPSGTVLGRQLIEIKVCACPNRDRMSDEKTYEKKIRIVQPAALRTTKDIRKDNTPQTLHLNNPGAPPVFVNRGGADRQVLMGESQFHMAKRLDSSNKLFLSGGGQQTTRQTLTKTLTTELTTTDQQAPPKYTFEVYGKENFAMLNKILESVQSLQNQFDRHKMCVEAKFTGLRENADEEKFDSNGTKDDCQHSPSSPKRRKVEEPEEQPAPMRRVGSIFAIIKDQHDYALPPEPNQSQPEVTETPVSSEAPKPLNECNSAMDFLLRISNRPLTNFQCRRFILDQLRLPESFASKFVSNFCSSSLTHAVFLCQTPQSLVSKGFSHSDVLAFFSALSREISPPSGDSQLSCSPEILTDQVIPDSSSPSHPLVSQETLPASQVDPVAVARDRSSEKTAVSRDKDDQPSIFQVVRFSMRQSITLPASFDYKTLPSNSALFGSQATGGDGLDFGSFDTGLLTPPSRSRVQFGDT